MAHDWDAGQYLRVADAFPRRADGEVLPPCPRLFFIATQPG